MGPHIQSMFHPAGLHPTFLICFFLAEVTLCDGSGVKPMLIISLFKCNAEIKYWSVALAFIPSTFLGRTILSFILTGLASTLNIARGLVFLFNCYLKLLFS